ncbi:polyprotein [Anopheles sinensis]|uniref:Polyprotein n=1 Tax=Anopheles sinensis TaxID=74873 RepID=A0A084VY22_ANOSI|nr:polyprotein [Anopheles sinensis]
MEQNRTHQNLVSEWADGLKVQVVGAQSDTQSFGTGSSVVFHTGKRLSLACRGAKEHWLNGADSAPDIAIHLVPLDQWKISVRLWSMSVRTPHMGQVSPVYPAIGNER